MAIGTMKQSDRNTAYLNQYIADTEADISRLPTTCSPGSTCIVVETGAVYMFNNQRQWVPFGNASGGSGGVGGGTSSTVSAVWKPFA